MMTDTNEELQHLAPLPWSMTTYGIWDAKNRAVLNLSLRLENEKLLEMVVRAVNSHDELVTALKETARLLTVFVQDDTDDIAMAIFQALSALSKARGETP